MLRRWNSSSALFTVVALATVILNPFSVFTYEHAIRSVVIAGLWGLLALLLWRRRVQYVRLTFPLRFALIGILLAGIISTVFGVSPLTAFWGSFTRFQGIFWWGTLALGALLALQDWVKEEHLQTALIWGGNITAFFALLQFFGLDPLAQPNRIHGTLGHPNFLAIVLLMTSTAVAVQLLRSRYSWKSLFFLLLQYTALFLTFTRTTYILLAGTIAALSIAAILLYWNSDRRRVYRTVVALVGMVILSFGLSALFANGKTREYALFTSTAAVSSILEDAALNERNTNPLLDRVGSIDDGGGSLQVRKVLFQEGVGIAADYWITGTGAENILYIYPEYYRNDLDRPTVARQTIADRTHFDALDTLIQYGVLGLLSWYALYGLLLLYGIRFLWQHRNDGATPQVKRVLLFTLLIAQYVLFNQINFSTLTTQVIMVMASARLVAEIPSLVQLLPQRTSRVQRSAAVIIAALSMCIVLRFGFVTELASMYAFRLRDVTADPLDAATSLDTARMLAPEQTFYPYEQSRLFLSAVARYPEQSAELLTLAEDRGNLSYSKGLRGLFYHQQMANIFVTSEALFQTPEPKKEPHEQYIRERVPYFGE